MAARMMLVNLGLLILGLVLLAAGAIIEPPRTASNPISEMGESLIALGLTFVVISIGFFLAWSAERMLSQPQM